jgi:hypothetical protein
MTAERYDELNDDATGELPITAEESAEGWHWCMEFDGLLVKGDPKEEYCGAACIAWNGEL